jgi:hypothetical protein
MPNSNIYRENSSVIKERERERERGREGDYLIQHEISFEHRCARVWHVWQRQHDVVRRCKRHSYIAQIKTTTLNSLSLSLSLQLTTLNKITIDNRGRRLDTRRLIVQRRRAIAMRRHEAAPTLGAMLYCVALRDVVKVRAVVESIRSIVCLERCSTNLLFCFTVVVRSMIPIHSLPI